jgi:hypothetical protein
MSFVKLAHRSRARELGRDREPLSIERVSKSSISGTDCHLSIAFKIWRQPDFRGSLAHRLKLSDKEPSIATPRHSRGRSDGNAVRDPPLEDHACLARKPSISGER